MTQLIDRSAITIDPARLERARAARLNEDERLVNMERARILMDAEREHAELARVPLQAAILRDLCERTTPVIREDDVLLGRVPEVIPTAEEEALIEARPELFVEPGVPGWLDSISICVPEWDLLLERGLGGIADDARDRLASADGEQAEFYRAVISAMESVATLIRRYAAHARDLSREASPERRAELAQIVERCERVAWQPPRDLPEALQLLQIVHMLLSCLVGGRDVTPGRMDQYLLPFYRASIDSGQLSRDDAVTLLAMFMLRLSQTAGNASDFESNHRRSPCMYTHLYVTVGGIDREGRPAENELSVVLVDAIRLLAYKEPTLLLRYHAEIDPELLRTVTELIADRLPVTVYNDGTVIPGLVENGVTEADARDYAFSACHNAFVPSVEAGTGPGGFHDVPQMLLDALADAKEPATFEELWDGFAHQVRLEVERKREWFEHFWSQKYADATPLLYSALKRAALAKGESCWTAAPVSHFNHYFAGVATTIDSLIAIRELVFGEDAAMSPAELREVLADDWSGHEGLRGRIRTELPRFGQDHPAVREIARRVGDLWCDELQRASQEMERFRMWPGFYSHMAHLRLGAATAATPDGRGSGDVLSENLSPSQGTPRCSAPSKLLSMSALPFDRAPSGAATLHLSLGELDREARGEVIRGLMEAYFDLGGLHLQVTVVDRETLEDAVRNPADHRDLMVRVAGFNAYFVLLPESEQQDIIRRCES
ncbi:MAG: hypothetical protein GF393_09285 [Armatimonadia bacterium]|nr:hypothetical protein [Armatimonadia bacterium]